MLISRKSLNSEFLEDGEKAEHVARLVSKRAMESFIVNIVLIVDGAVTKKAPRVLFETFQN